MSNRKSYGHESAYKLAWEQLGKIDDIAQQCLRCGAQYQEIDSKKIIIIDYLNQSYQIDLPGTEILLINSEEEVPIKAKLLILHY